MNMFLGLAVENQSMPQPFEHPESLHAATAVDTSIEMSNMHFSRQQRKTAGKCVRC